MGCKCRGQMWSLRAGAKLTAKSNNNWRKPRAPPLHTKLWLRRCLGETYGWETPENDHNGPMFSNKLLAALHKC